MYEGALLSHGTTLIVEIKADPPARFDISRHALKTGALTRQEGREGGRGKVKERAMRV